MDTIAKTNAAAAPKPLLAETADLTALILAPRWRLGRRAAAKRAVAATAEALRPLARRVAVACQGAAAPALRDARAGEIIIVPDSESPLSALGCALDACGDDLILVVAAGTRPSARIVQALVSALQDDETAGVSACVELRRPVGLPLLCRRSLRPIVAACLYAGQTSLLDVLRRPCARLITLD
jgi:molybdopterin-guanine dinucleotide biosynthesis protein A